MNGFILGEIFVANLRIILCLIAGFFVFSSAPYLMAAFLFLPVNSLFLFFLCYLLALKESVLKKPFLLSFLFVLFSVLFSAYWTTMGTFFAIAALPLILYGVVKSKNKFLTVLFLGAFLACVFYFFQDLILNYMAHAKEYVKGNLAAFGNGYGFYVNLFWYVLRCFALFSVPFVLLELFSAIRRKNKDIQYIFFLTFALLFVFASISYALGRIDYEVLGRAYAMSCAYIAVLLPYFILKKDLKWAKNIFVLLMIAGCVNVFFARTINNFKNIKRENIEANKDFEYLGKMKLKPKHEERLLGQKALIDKYSKKGDTFLDLANAGMNYLYFDRKMPVLYVSYYNSITTNQAKESVSRLENNPPVVILVTKYLKYTLDNIPASLRIYPVYRYILLSKMYEFKSSGEDVILVKTDKKKTLSKDELYRLDYLISASKIAHLAEAYANSLNTLPLDKIELDYDLEVTKGACTIKFKKPIKGENLAFVYFEPKFEKEIYNKKYIVEINSSKTKLYLDSYSGEVLFPFDSLPSWLMNNDISEIKINIKNKGNLLKSANVAFYKRSN